MLRNFLGWFIVFGLSFLIQSLGWADQGTAFMYMYLGSTVLVLIVFALAFLLKMKVMETVITLVTGAVVVGIILFVAWVISQLFNVNFYVAYQIMTFVGCFVQNNKKK